MCNPTGSILTSFDINVGQSDLYLCMLEDLKEANTNTTETQLLASRKFMPWFKSTKIG